MTKRTRKLVRDISVQTGVSQEQVLRAEHQAVLDIWEDEISDGNNTTPREVAHLMLADPSSFSPSGAAVRW